MKVRCTPRDVDVAEMRCYCRDLDGGETRHGWGEMLISGPGWK